MSKTVLEPLTAPGNGQSFDEVVLPHLDAAYRLACWLMRNEHDAEDVVQEASLRAFRYFRTFQGGNGRAWFLRIVRNTCSGVRGHSVEAATDPFDEEHHSTDRPGSDPEALLLHTDDAALIERAMSRLPDRFRELLVLREIEGLSYRELADVLRMPIGTVMSRLSRARQAFRAALENKLAPSGSPEDTAPRTPGRGGAGVKDAARTATADAIGGSVEASGTAASDVALATNGGQQDGRNDLQSSGTRGGWPGERICA